MTRAPEKLRARIENQGARRGGGKIISVDRQRAWRVIGEHIAAKPALQNGAGELAEAADPKLQMKSRLCLGT